MNNAYDIVIRPVLTEKTAGLMEDGTKVVFRVHQGANKHQIREAIETLFGVKVTGVNTMRAPGRARRFGRYVGRRNGYKKAVVTLAEGQTFDLFAMENSGEEAGEA
jgi:large subunit ribosomal protein L23